MDKDNEIYVSISHSHLDYEKVRIVRNLLEQEGYRPLMFFLKCLENEKYEELTKTLIKEEFDNRQRFILCASEHAKTSDWVKFEINHVLLAQIDLMKLLNWMPLLKPKYMLSKISNDDLLFSCRTQDNSMHLFI